MTQAVHLYPKPGETDRYMIEWKPYICSEVQWLTCKYADLLYIHPEHVQEQLTVTLSACPLQNKSASQPA